MRLADIFQVSRTYPGVPAAAVARLLWALDDAGALTGADTPAIEKRLRSGLASYRGPWSDFAKLRVPEIFAALQTHRPAAVGDTLQILGLIDTTRTVRVVIAADKLAGRVWARERGFPLHEVAIVRTAVDLHALAGVDDPAGVLIVRLNACTPHVEDVLRRLRENGATEVAPHWRPVTDTAAAGRR